ncbi:DUF2318 domain-containing protein [Campylobacter sp. LR291e]|uniref:Fe-S-containing protein n=1 Tax=unclassified Campylobacter TaxID=2593542 RepID=UPI0012383A93|nr:MULTISPECIES: Fe-S-containing protein [unclassified Campylobacter]KAA6227831.1 DUF2318 domain-containing protein [Campylobacter sp. LR185c]KAA6228239.1 DUF2318 domain-containing protein [Campylobacter sp. LR196d]KAA6229239.1 DUF2318 domain-containing protein [Campylobacter sp. LR291e]KAA6231044.1 DUF2318 domain-containing protein [Campylobacter sp. LR264d]KAA8604482.1 hypothetical protein CGP82_02875 [Campylobacter sp. LR185c]
MNIYFVHFISFFMPLFIFVSLIVPKKAVLNNFLALFLGVLFSYFAFFIAAQFLKTQNLAFVFNFVFIVTCLFTPILFFWQNKILSYIISFLLSFCLVLGYYTISQDFPIFSTSLLDSVAISSLGFIGLGMVFCVVIFFFLKWQKTYNKTLSFIFLILLILFEFDKVLANIFLTLMRNDIIPTYSVLLSFVAKSLYFGGFFIYIYLFYIIFLAFFTLRIRLDINQKKGFLDSEFRKKIAQRSFVNNYFMSILFISLCSLFILAYFHTISSKPIKIDPPTELVPNEEGNFVFNVDLLNDNNLHRFSYVSSEGKVIRFFLINKREDKSSPVAVFDACMICGDLGYIKKGGELICIACNVRIFLPSVGKFGGCNPIPLEYKVENGKIIIALKDVVAGSSYFNEIKEIEVSDPVSKEKLINLKAPYSYSYKGITYYFTNEKNYELFKEDPAKFVDENSAIFLIQRRNDVS